MDDKLKIFWNLDVLVKMSRSKSDGPSLHIEENEINDKIQNYTQEIEEIKAQTDEEIYDTSAEMADRNIEIITKKHLQSYKNELKEKNKQLVKLKEEETNLYGHTSLLRENKASQEKYILSMQERISEVTDIDVIDRYNGLIAETSEKVVLLSDELTERSSSYNSVQEQILTITEEISTLEEKIDKKKKLLAETQANLENKDNYIDKSKKEKNAKKIAELENKIEKLNQRLIEIHKDPKYIETKIKEVINEKEDISKAKPYLIDLINFVIKIPYINVPVDNTLEEELLRATQARDSFANELDQKTYNILETNSPEKIRTDFLYERITKWQQELELLNEKINQIDKDKQFAYEEKDKILASMIATMKNDLKEFEKAYAEAPDVNISAKASIKAALDEKREDIIEAEKIATAFRKDESEDISTATRTIKYDIENLKTKIYNAEEEINAIKNRLTSKKSGLIDITSRNKDKDILKELAQTVIDIKHRRQFPETPLEIVNRLEEELGIDLVNNIDKKIIDETSEINEKNYDEYLAEKDYEVIETADVTPTIETLDEVKRGIKVVDKAEISHPDYTEEESSSNKDNESLIEKQLAQINKENVEITAETEYDNAEIEEEAITEEESLAEDITISSNEESESVSEEKTLPEEQSDYEIEQSLSGYEKTENYSQEGLTSIDEPTEESAILASQEEIEDNKEIVEYQVEENEDEEPLDIESIINKPTEEPVIELESDIPSIPENEISQLSIDSMFNNTEETENEDDDVSSDWLENELDQYINTLNSNKD